VQSALMSAARAEEWMPRSAHHSVAKCRPCRTSLPSTMTLRGAPITPSISASRRPHGLEGIVASSAAMGILLQQGIGDTVRVSLTRSPAATARSRSKWPRNSCRHGFRVFVHGRGVPGLRTHTSTTFRNCPGENPGFFIHVSMRNGRRAIGVESLTRP